MLNYSVAELRINNNRWNPQAFYVPLGRKKSTTFLMILRKVYKKRGKVSNLRYSPSSPYFYKFTVGASLCTILISFAISYNIRLHFHTTMISYYLSYILCSFCSFNIQQLKSPILFARGIESQILQI